MKMLLKIFNNIEKVVAVNVFILLIILGFLQVVFRFFLNFSLDWTEELSRFGFILLVYISASLAVTEDRHVRVEAIDMILKGNAKIYMRIFTEIIWLIVGLIVVVTGFQVAADALAVGQTSPALLLPMGYVYLIIPVTFLMMSIRVIQKIVERVRSLRKGVSPQ